MMKKLRVVAAVAIATAKFGLAASSAFAAVEARVSANGPHTFTHGVATVDLFVNCTDSVTGSDLLTDASLSVTLTQVHRSATKVEEIRCFGDDLVDITFRRFHPGEAFVEATLTACDVNNPADCDTGNLATEITFVRG
jgi:hypothetical protein